MKKFVILVMVAMAALSACSVNEGLHTKGQANQLNVEYPVGLLNAQKRYDSSLGQYVTRGYIEVTDLALDKEVTVVYRVGTGEWTSVAASYYAETVNGKEAWFFQTPGLANQSETVELAIEYKVNGATYWDNNDGQNYKVGPNWWGNVEYFGTVLGRQNVLLYSAHANPGYGHISGNVAVKNIGFAKTVEIVWTTNNWQSSGVLTANHTLATEPGRELELWSYSGTFPAGTLIEFAVSYNVNGQNYWDNNYGENYSAQL